MFENNKKEENEFKSIQIFDRQLREKKKKRSFYSSIVEINEGNFIFNVDRIKSEKDFDRFVVFVKEEEDEDDEK